MHDIPKTDDPLLRAIFELRDYVDGLIDQEKRRVGEWAEETARAGDLAATAEVGGQRHGGAFASTAARGEKRSDGGDRGAKPAPTAPREVVPSRDVDRRGSGQGGDLDDPRKRLDALAKRLDGRVVRPQGPAADGS